MAASVTAAPQRTDPEVEHLDVLIVGAGLSGIGAAHHIQERRPSDSYAILEAREALGGTWDLFRYPGIRSDSDMYTLGYRFKPWTDAKAIADGAGDPATTCARPRASPASTATSATATGSCAPSGRRPTPAGRSPCSAPTPARPRG